VAGIFDGQSFDSGVMIRFIEQKNGLLYYRSGGGITTQSILEKEYQEAIDKIYVPLN
jgi:para-aminobenzoate synthetase component 1